MQRLILSKVMVLIALEELAVQWVQSIVGNVERDALLS